VETRFNDQRARCSRTNSPSEGQRAELDYQTHTNMSLLEKLGLTKQSMEKMLGVVAVAKKNKIKRYRRYETVPADIREAILKEHPSYTCRELAKKYGISSSTIWDIRESKSRIE
jgi:hypothetical protein